MRITIDGKPIGPTHARHVMPVLKEAIEKVLLAERMQSEADDIERNHSCSIAWDLGQATALLQRSLARVQNCAIASEEGGSGTQSNHRDAMSTEV